MKNTGKYNVKTQARKSNEARTLFEQVNITDNFTLIVITIITDAENLLSSEALRICFSFPCLALNDLFLGDLFSPV